MQADLLLHVVDASNANRDDQIAEVNKVLAEIGAADIPQVLVFNKIDLQDIPPSVQRDDYGKICPCFLECQKRARVWMACDSPWLKPRVRVKRRSNLEPTIK